MNKRFLKIPLDTTELMKPGNRGRVGLEKSIIAHINLIISTVMGEHRYDEEYGFKLWSYDFEMLTTRRWKDQMAQSLLQAVNRYEKRLGDTKVEVEVRQVEWELKKVHQIRKKMFVNLNAKLSSTGSSFKYSTGFFISPLDMAEK